MTSTKGAGSDPAPAVSVVIPVYNGANYLRDAIESALAQTHPAFEVVVVNDGSNDGGQTDQIARSYVPRIRYLAKDNGGVASALNRGIAEARGEWISWLSHDDVLYPDKLSRQLALARGERLTRTLIFGDFDVDDVDAGRCYPARLPRHCQDDRRGLAALTLLLTSRLHGCTLLMPRSCFPEVGPFREDLRTTQDYDLWFRLLAAGFGFRYLPGTVVTSRVHAQQGTRVMSDIHRRETIALYERVLSSHASALRHLPPWQAFRIAQSWHAKGLERLARAFLTQWSLGSRARGLATPVLRALASPRRT